MEFILFEGSLWREGNLLICFQAKLKKSGSSFLTFLIVKGVCRTPYTPSVSATGKWELIFFSNWSSDEKPLCCWWLIWLIQNDAKTWKMTETLTYWYSSESTPQELSNEYQHDRVKMVFKHFCVPLFWTKVASALEGLRQFNFNPSSLWLYILQNVKCFLLNKWQNTHKRKWLLVQIYKIQMDNLSYHLLYWNLLEIIKESLAFSNS